MKITEQAVEAALDTWLDHEFDGTLNYPRMRNALAAAIRALSSPDHADGSKSTSDQKVCQTCNDRGIIGGMHRVGDGDVDAWEGPCPDCQKVKAHHSDADTGPDDLVQIALHLNCDPDADSILHVVREIQADLDIAKHADAGKVEGDGIERGKFYHHHWPMEKLLEARRDGLVDHSGGEAWRYEYSHKDEHGKYDILYRPVKNLVIPARLPSAPASEGAE